MTLWPILVLCMVVGLLQTLFTPSEVLVWVAALLGGVFALLQYDVLLSYKGSSLFRHGLDNDRAKDKKA